MRLREVKEFAQRHTADEWPRPDLNPVRIQEGFAKRPDLAVAVDRAKAWKRA